VGFLHPEVFLEGGKGNGQQDQEQEERKKRKKGTIVNLTGVRSIKEKRREGKGYRKILIRSPLYMGSGMVQHPNPLGEKG